MTTIKTYEDWKAFVRSDKVCHAGYWIMYDKNESRWPAIVHKGSSIIVQCENIKEAKDFIKNKAKEKADMLVTVEKFKNNPMEV